tara:strand:- start:231 stop:437 length:207 start_codon:yes stop_codon:yes gene_type:complete
LVTEGVSIEIVIAFADWISLMSRRSHSLNTELINNSWPSFLINVLINLKLSDFNALKVIVIQTQEIGG